MTSPRAMDVHWSSKDQQRLTPDRLIEAILNFWPEIHLDPCAEELRRGEGFNVPAEVHYTESMDGLSRPWFPHTYCNPPYNEIERWVDKAIAESSDPSKGVEILFLVPARPGSVWWGKLRNYPILFFNGRLKFGKETNSAPFPSAMVLIDPLQHHLWTDFAKSFESWGDVWVRLSPASGRISPHICNHEWIWIGTDDHRSRYVCSNCGSEKRRKHLRR